MQEAELPAKPTSKRKLVATKTFHVFWLATVAVGAAVIEFFQPEAIKYAIHSIQYSGVSIVRFVPVLIALFVLTAVCVSYWQDSTKSFWSRVGKICGVSGFAFLFLFAGAFFKDPFYTTSYLMKEYQGPVRTIQSFAGLEVELGACNKLGRELTCEFRLSNLRPDDTQFQVSGRSYMVDHKSSKNKMSSFLVGEREYRGHQDGTKFVAPLNSSRTIKLKYPLSADDKVDMVPLVNLHIRISGQRKDMMFRNIAVTGY